MSTSISFGGLASGLDTTAIINALVGAQEIPILSLEAKKEKEQDKLDLVGNLESLVKELKTKASALTSLGGFLSHSITPSEEGVANFSVTGAPLTGSHTMTVNSLAAADRWNTVGIADDAALLGMGTISFDYDGASYSVAIDPISSTIHDIAGAINAQAGEAVQASVVNTGTASSPSFELVVEGKDTGSDYAITNLTSSVAGLAFEAAPLTAASNASITLDGLTVERSSNEFSDVIEGLSIEVVAADVNKTISFAIGVDTEDIQTKLEDFLETYNKIHQFIGDQNVYSEEGGAGGLLFGDNLLQSVKSAVYNGFVAVDPLVVQADTEGYSALSLLGIKSSVGGELELDTAKLNEKMSGNIDLFAGFFADSADGSTPGAFSNLVTQLETLTDSMGNDANGDPLDGLFEVRKDALTSNIDDMDDSILDMRYRLDKYEGTLVAKYAALEVLMAELQVQEAAAANLASLNFGSST